LFFEKLAEVATYFFPNLRVDSWRGMALRQRRGTNLFNINDNIKYGK